MTDLDHMQRRLSDLETIVREQGYRIKALEKAGHPFRAFKAPQPVVGELIPEYHARLAQAVQSYVNGQFCECGRDVCRAPDCPSHKTDPMGR